MRSGPTCVHCSIRARGQAHVYVGCCSYPYTHRRELHASMAFPRDEAWLQSAASYSF